MKESAVLPLFLIALACGGPVDEPSSEEPDMSSEMLGRWDVTAQGDETYPLWFELVEKDGVVQGRFQPRFGHAVPIDRVEISGAETTLQIEKDTYTGSLRGDRWEGTGVMEDGSQITWTAVRAPELKAPENPEWGDPIELFNGKDLSGWVARHPSQPNMWKAEDGVLANTDTGSDLVTEAEFEDFKLHIEVNYPQGSNSGIYLRGRYEIQVQDDYGKEPHSLYMGAVYGHITPTENTAKPAGEWQVFDITLLGRWVTVELNGKVIIDHQEIPGITGGALDANEGEPGPFMLQGDHGPVSYRNILVTPVRKST
jgi:hypothetical protein